MYSRLKRLYHAGRLTDEALATAVTREWITEDEKRKSSERNQQHNHFRCSHHSGVVCRMNLKECTGKTCTRYGTCGECERYYMPPGQEPCRSCRWNTQ